MTAIILGIGRAIVETMTVMIVLEMPRPSNRVEIPVLADRTMTATNAAEVEIAKGVHYHVLFFIGIVLF
jgi:phosphate transport system permease protein